MTQENGSFQTKVIVVDDDVVDYNVIRRGFKKADMQATFLWARDGVEAIELLKSHRKQGEDLSRCMLLVDLNMPRMNGIELIRHLRDDQHFQHSPIVVLTTSKRDEDREAASTFGIEDYIVKDELMHNFDRLLKVYKKIDHSTPI